MAVLNFTKWRSFAIFETGNAYLVDRLCDRAKIL